MEEKFTKAFAMIKMVMDEFGDCECEEFQAFTCMLVEEWCLRHDYNVVEYHEKCAEAADFVRKVLGKYKGNKHVPV